MLTILAAIIYVAAVLGLIYAFGSIARVMGERG